MKVRYAFYFLAAIFFFTGFLSMGFAQSSQCIVTEKQGNLVTVTCPGEGTKIMSMGGSADIYKVGDKINVPKQIDQDRNAGRKGR